MASRRTLSSEVLKTIAESEAREEMLKLSEEYIEAKAKIKPLESVVKKTGTKIKELFSEANLQDLECGDTIVHVATRETTVFNEDVAMGILKQELPAEQLEQVIKTREYLDEEALEKLIYTHKVDATILAPATTPGKTVTTLSLKKKKAGK